MDYCDILNQNSLGLLEIQEWLIDVNLAIIYILTNFYIKKNSQSYCICYVRSLHIKIFVEMKKMDFCGTSLS